MAQAGYLVTVRSDKDSAFTDAIAQNAQESENITLPGAFTAGSRARLRSINVISLENLAWELWLFANNRFITDVADIDLVFPRGRWGWAATDGARIAGAGPYYYYIDGLDIAYQDLDMFQQLHIMLVNRSAAAKTAGANGAIVVELNFELTTGW